MALGEPNQMTIKQTRKIAKICSAPGKLMAIFWFGFPPGNPNRTSDFVRDGMG